MKLHYGILLLALLVVVIFWPGQRARAQDTLTVQWETTPGSGQPLINALVDAIKKDTVAGGGRANAGRVYKLKAGGFYWITERIENKDYHLRIVGEMPGATALLNPAVIQMYPRADGTVDGRILTGGSSVTLKNLWLTGRDYNGVQTYYQPIQIDASNSRFVFDNCVLEHTNFALIAFTAKNNEIFYTNCKFRNLIGQPSTQQWEGRGMSIWADQDTVVVENCTFFNVEMTAFQLEGGAANYIRFNHNTIVNLGRSINTGSWFREAYFANCLIINGWWHGEGWRDYDLTANPSRDPRAISSGLFSISALPSKYGPEQGRRIVFANMAAWRDPKFATFYGDTIRKQYYINRVTKEDFIDKYSDHMKIKDTLWLASEPGLPSYASVAALIDSMIQHIRDLRVNKTPATRYFYMPTQYPTDVAWPLPENFAYTDATLKTKGTDGLPLGDLNWFPTQKAQWEANKAKNIADIEALAGTKVKLDVVATAQAEAGSLAGSAAVSTFQGFSYFQMDGGGYLEWTFNMAAAATVDLKVWSHMRNNSKRGEFIKINGTNIRNSSGSGEFIWDVAAGIPQNEWTWLPTITKASLVEGASALDLPQGTNTIRIQSSWGWQHFAGVDILTAGTSTVLKSLRAPDVTAYEIVTLKAEGAKWVPDGLKSVALGTNGSITWLISAPSTGTYRLNIFYQNPGSQQTAQIKVDGVTAISSYAMAGKADSTGTNALSDGFNLIGGSHAFTLSGAQVKVDYIQLIKESTVSSVDNELPQGYALEQNYPNPFNPTTTISFALGKASNVKLTVYNLLGQKVATLIDSRLAAGAHTVLFDASKLSSGVYIYRLDAVDFRAQKKMMLIK
jgi:hypothetical protein